MPTYRKVAIIGVGLIGGSIGLALRQHKLAAEVVGIGRRQASLVRALACEAVDAAETNLETGVAGAELVVVATPVAEIADYVCRSLAVGPEIVVTDAGSTKAAICTTVEARVGPAARHFVGAHPLAGDHRTGPENARPELFQGRTVVVTPTGTTSPEAVAKVTQLWQNLGARVTKLPPAEHDEALAATSHLPHLVASALAAATPDRWLDLAATGWADTTRVAAGDPELWMQIFAQNRPAVLAAIARLDRELKAYEGALAAEDWAQLKQLLDQAKRTRDAVGN